MIEYILAGYLTVGFVVFSVQFFYGGLCFCPMCAIYESPLIFLDSMCWGYNLIVNLINKK